MEDKVHKPGLYKWKRQTPTRLYSRSQNVTTKDDIKDWIKKVEDATDKAAEATFGSYYSSGRERGRYAALQSVQQLHEHDEIHSEAQELLTQWMNEKVVLSDDIDIDDEYWPRIRAQAEVKAEWDHLLADNTDDWDLTNSARSQYASTPTDNFFDVDNLDETSAVESIVQRMLGKQVVQEDFLNDLGLDESKKRKDPRLKMELRHQQVKENREKREKELEKKRRALRERKDAHLQAKQIIKKEEQEKEINAKHEEMEIKQEMASIRKQMQEDRKKMEEEALRRKKEKWQSKNVSRSEIEQRLMEENKQQMLRQLEQEEKRRLMFKKLEKFQAKQAAKNLLILQQHFSAWYKIVLERRLRIGKARALSDWRTLLRAWNAWRSYVRSRRIDIETRQFEQSIVEANRKNQQAQRHHRCTLLRKYLTAWQLYVHQEAERREMEETQNRTRSKMMALLDAAATGKLWNEKKAEEDAGNKRATGRNTVSDADKIDEIFDDRKRPQSVPLSSRSGSSISSSIGGGRCRPNSSRLPTEAWQVTRRHVNLTKDELSRLGGGGDGGEATTTTPHSDLEIRRRFGKQPWMNSPYIVNNFEHRYTAQQKMLHEQQKQIRDQQRLLEEIQYNQRNQQLRHQADEQHALYDRLSRQPVPEEEEERSPWKPVPEEERLTPRHEQLSRQQVPLKGERSSRQLAGAQNESEWEEGEGDGLSRRSVVEQQLNNMFDVHQHQGRIASQQHNAVAKDKETNITLDTARTKSSVSSSTRTAVTTARSDLSVRSGATSSTSNNKYLKVLKTMEERTAERSRLKAEREEKRKKAEEEKMAMLLAHEEDLRRQAEEDKRARVEAYKEKKRLEKQREIDKQQQAERMRELNRLADAHYLRSIVKYRGLVVFKKLVQMSHDAEQRAVEHHKSSLMRKVFAAWHGHASHAMQEKSYLADGMYKFLLLKRCLNQWKNYKHCMKIMEQKGRRFYEQNVLGKIVTAWAHYAMEEKIASWEKERMAKDHYLRSVQKKTFQAWRRLPDELMKEKDREKRRIEMRKKVQMLIPDYEGTVDKSVDISFHEFTFHELTQVDISQVDIS
ncbi:coiled-coil domain-containing protein 191-like [Gigantopelta aegis]|uniref:coiled-coil domain-containing protein 191-like n=1 Tax=Gigantopelta aegis TaxID=1735272 RepID=UPI001B8896F7|nr:coiled-coil domain-containing protein 191-like [Gigantopelta aegis]